jgi:hypothetical protein
LIISEPKFVSGSRIALPAAALRASTMINKHRDRHKNQLISETDDRLVDVNINNAPSITTMQHRFATRACPLDDNTMSINCKPF